MANLESFTFIPIHRDQPPDTEWKGSAVQYIPNNLVDRSQQRGYQAGYLLQAEG